MFAAGILALTTTVAAANGPSFDCSRIEPGSIAAAICGNEELAALDRRLAAAFAQASAKAANERPPVLQAEQRGWIKGRDECWKATDRDACITDAYVRRIAELQARYRLVPHGEAVSWTCDGDPASEIVTTAFSTEPPTLLAERGDTTSLMFQARSASGAKYEGRNEIFWEHQGQARVTWGYGAPEMTCVRASALPGTTGKSKAQPRNVVINGQRLSDAELQRAEQSYRIRIPDAEYWYDPVLGAWGARGGPTMGFIAPGLALGGRLPADASGGGTGVFVNGRELHPYDLAALQQITGPILPARYFIAANGLAGYEGGPPLWNLAAMAAQAQGDVRTWQGRVTASSGFSDGTHTAVFLPNGGIDRTGPD
jgi:uncharacterized protein